MNETNNNINAAREAGRNAGIQMIADVRQWLNDETNILGNTSLEIFHTAARSEDTSVDQMGADFGWELTAHGAARMCIKNAIYNAMWENFEVDDDKLSIEICDALLANE